MSQKDAPTTESASWQLPKATIDRADELLSSVLHGRGLSKKDQQKFLQPDYQNDLGDPFLMAGMSVAVGRIHTAISKKERIVIYGDYDIDGLTASSLLYYVLRQSSPNVESYIPDRFEEGYGLNKEALCSLHKKGTQLVITVDCGITSVQEVAEATKLGLDIIVTDHHTVPEVIPSDAVAVINPRQPGDKYPYRDLAGVGVAFALVRALQQKYPEIIEVGQEKWLLDLVALGTVCDVVPLTGENRTLVSYGLQVLRKTRRPGLKALAAVSGVEVDQIQTDTLGFRFGPRLNAAGRLEHAKKSLRLLTTEDYEDGLKYAAVLDQLNAQRQQMTAEVFEAANERAIQQADNLVLVLADADWSHGIAGLVASKISERHHKPTFILQTLGDTTKGSARSFGKLNIIEAIGDSSKDLTKYGGHAFAAGVTLPTSKIDDFRRAINQYVQKKYSKADFVTRLDIDAVLADSLLDLTSLDNLQKLEPYGNGNPSPLFSSRLHLEELRFIGQTRTHTKFRFRTQDRKYIDGISFNSSHRWPDGLPSGPVEVVYRLQDNTWQDRRSLQLEVVDIRAIDSA